MDICFAGDCNFISEIYEIDPDKLIVDKSVWESDMHFINLEQAISENTIKTPKYMMYSGSECLPYLMKMKVNGVSLANNHIHDKGVSGIEDTIHFLDSAEILHTGAGKDITEAEIPIKICENLYMLAFCDYGKSYIRDVKCASKKEAGVNFFSVERVFNQLDKLPNGTGGIVYIHWGIEYSWLPPYECIKAAKEILSHPKAKLLIGQHAHIPLGWVKNKEKYAFFSLGNFLFSNFYLCPPNVVKSSCNDNLKRYYPKVKIMCNVKTKIYKQWYFTNRVSLLVHYNTKDESVKIQYTIQDQETPYIRELKGGRKKMMTVWLNGISHLYKWPASIYRVLFKINLFTLYGIRKLKRGMVNYYYGRTNKTIS